MRSTRARRWIFSGAVTVALGFGTAQAFASPVAPGTARACDLESCRNECRAQGFFGDVACVDVRGQPMCFCYF